MRTRISIENTDWIDEEPWIDPEDELPETD